MDIDDGGDVDDDYKISNNDILTKIKNKNKILKLELKKKYIDKIRKIDNVNNDDDDDYISDDWITIFKKSTEKISTLSCEDHIKIIEKFIQTKQIFYLHILENICIESKQTRNIILNSLKNYHEQFFDSLSTLKISTIFQTCSIFCMFEFDDDDDELYIFLLNFLLHYIYSINDIYLLIQYTLTIITQNQLLKCGDILKQYFINDTADENVWKLIIFYCDYNFDFLFYFIFYLKSNFNYTHVIFRQNYLFNELIQMIFAKYFSTYNLYLNFLSSSPSSFLFSTSSSSLEQISENDLIINNNNTAFLVKIKKLFEMIQIILQIFNKFLSKENITKINDLFEVQKTTTTTIWMK